MINLGSYRELVRELKELLDKAIEAVAQEKYTSLEQILFQNEVLLNKHNFILNEVDLAIRNNQQLTLEEQKAITEMQIVLENWNDETLRMTKFLENAKETTQKALIEIQQGKQLLYTYHPQNKAPSRFVDKQQ